MNIYFSCSITGGRQDQVIYARIVDFLVNKGHIVLTAHLSDPDVLSEELLILPADVYKRDKAWVRNCDILVAEVSTPSHGVGYEIALAEKYKKPIFCCTRKGKKISKMITGNPYKRMVFYSYTSTDDLLFALQKFVENDILN